MVNFCSVFGCKNRNVPNRSFHRFPTNEALKTKWINATGRLNWRPKFSSRICSIHFDSNAIIKKGLKSDAVPVKFVHEAPKYYVALKQYKKLQSRQMNSVKSVKKQTDCIPTKCSPQDKKNEKKKIPRKRIKLCASRYNKINVLEGNTLEISAMDYDTSDAESVSSTFTDLETIKQQKVEVTDNVLIKSEIENGPPIITSVVLDLENSQVEEHNMNESHLQNQVVEHYIYESHLQCQVDENNMNESLLQNKQNFLKKEHDENNKDLSYNRTHMSILQQILKQESEIKQEELDIGIEIINLPSENNCYNFIPEEYHSLVKYIHKQTGIDEECIILCLNKIILNISFKEYTKLINVIGAGPMTIFNYYIPIIAKALHPFIIKPSVNEVKKKLPITFRCTYNDIYTIMDVLEIKVENGRRFGTDTVKYVICNTPDGFINYISPGIFENINSDARMENHNFSDHLKEGISILVDNMDMTIIKQLKFPNNVTKKLVNLRVGRPINMFKNYIKSIYHSQKRIQTMKVYMERLKERLKKFNMLNTILNREFIDLLDDIVVIACALINYDQLLKDL